MLEFCTNQELISELSKRITFAGIIIYSQDEHLRDNQIHEDFCVSTVLDNNSLKNLLEKIVKELA